MSPTTESLGGIVNVALGALPSILALIKQRHSTAHPEAPPLTDADVFAALAYAVASSVAKDEAWLRAHPVELDRKPADEELGHRPRPPLNDTGD